MNAFRPFSSNPLVLFCILLFGCTRLQIVSAQPTISLVSKITGLTAPIQVVNAGDGTGRLFVVQKGGIIKVYSSTYASLGNFLTVTGILTGGEQGLLSLVFHPNYESNGYFWVYYVNAAGNLEIARFKVSTSNANVADPASKVVVLTIPHPTNTNHNGGELHFGSDGYLYLSTGDGGGGGDQSNNSQNSASLLGKLLRLDVNLNASMPYYTVPGGNPFGNEVFCLGLRNPFRWSFDPLNGNLWIGDVGQNAWEEIDFRAAANINGTNFGWRCYEGNAVYNNAGCGPMSDYIFPVYVYQPAASIIGGEVYRGTYFVDLAGYYLSADYYSGNFYLIITDGMGGWTTTVQPTVKINVADFGVNEAGEIFVAVNSTGSTGSIFHVQASGNTPLELLEFTGRIAGPNVELAWKTASESNLSHFEIEVSADGIQFARTGSVPAENNPTGANYQFSLPQNATQNSHFRLKMIDFDGQFRFSNIVSFAGNKQSGAQIFPTVIENRLLVFQLDEPFETLEIVATDGRIVLSENISGQEGRLEIPLDGIAAGNWFVRLKSPLKQVTQPVFLSH